MPQARDAFVKRVVDGKIFALKFFVALPPVKKTRQKNPEVVHWAPRAVHQVVALRTAGLVDERRSRRPTGIVRERWLLTIIRSLLSRG